MSHISGRTGFEKPQETFIYEQSGQAIIEYKRSALISEKQKTEENMISEAIIT